MLLMVDYLTTSANVSTKLIPSSCSNLRATSLAFSSSTCPLDPTFDLKIGVFPTCQLSARSNFELLSPSLGLSLFPILCVELPDLISSY